MNQYNIVLNKQEADQFKTWLKVNGINFEPSAYGDGIYFNITATEEEAQTINKQIETLYN